MNDSTNQIHSFLLDKGIEENLRSFLKQHPDHRNYEQSLSDTLVTYLFIQDTLLDEIKSGRLDTFSYSLRLNFHTKLKGLSDNRGNVNYLMQNVDLLLQDIQASGILSNKIGKSDFQTERRKLNEQRRRYSELIAELEVKSENLSFIENSRNDLDVLLNKANETNSNLDQILLEVKERNAYLDANLSGQEAKLESIKNIQESIEEKRLSITTFSNNIEEYKNSIEKLSNELKNLINKKTEIDSLIKSAQEALKLGSAVGISSAFAAQYDNANNGHKKNWWILGSVLFLLSAITLTIWIVSDSANSEKLGVVLGRIVAVGISIAGAAFCAKQYVKQKHIAEDYAYKAVLSKSIVAFTEEIGASSDNPEQHIGNYLNKVLTEIHKDPLRERKASRYSRPFSDKQLEQLTEIVKSLKP